MCPVAHSYVQGIRGFYFFVKAGAQFPLFLFLTGFPLYACLIFIFTRENRLTETENE